MTDKQFLASEAWSTSGDLLQNPVTSKVASGVLGVAIRSSPIRGFEHFITNLNPSLRSNDEFLREFWEQEFGCSPMTSNVSSQSFHAKKSLKRTSLEPCSGTESLIRMNNHFTDISQLRVTYNVYLAVYAAAHALHSLLSCPDTDNALGHNRSTCSTVKHIKPNEVKTSVTC